MTSGEQTACPDCSGRPLDAIAEFAAAWVLAPARAPLPGWVEVVAKHHGEPSELQRVRLWEDAMNAAGALAGLYVGRPIEKEVHRGSDHWRVELRPRRAGDAYGEAVYLRGPADLRRIGEAMRRAGAT